MLQACGKSQLPRFALLETGFFALVVSTTLAIAVVSTWWVPVYLGFIVTIFVVPRRRRSPLSASEPDAEYNAVETTALGPGLRVDCANVADQFCSIGRSYSELNGAESAESSDANSDLNASGLIKLRRSRVRVRKIGKSIDPRATEPVQAAWIQTEPGKFVRIERDGIRAAESTEIVYASGPVAEEDGIAPSAFSLAPEPNDSVEGLEANLPGQSGESEIDTADRPEVDAQLRSGSADSQTRVRQLRGSRTWVVQIQHGIVGAVSGSSRVQRQRVTRTYARLPNLAGFWFPPYVSRHAAPRRGFRRMLDAHRALRIRSPPGR
jgi:hypothetical protein